MPPCPCPLSKRLFFLQIHKPSQVLLSLCFHSKLYTPLIPLSSCFGTISVFISSARQLSSGRCRAVFLLTLVSSESHTTPGTSEGRNRCLTDACMSEWVNTQSKAPSSMSHCLSPHGPLHAALQQRFLTPCCSSPLRCRDFLEGSTASTFIKSQPGMVSDRAATVTEQPNDWTNKPGLRAEEKELEEMIWSSTTGKCTESTCAAVRGGGGEEWGRAAGGYRGSSEWWKCYRIRHWWCLHNIYPNPLNWMLEHREFYNIWIMSQLKL